MKGKLTVTAGLGGMGGAQPLAVTMNDGHCIGVEVDEWRIDRRVETGYCDAKATSIDEALDLIEKADGPLSVGLLGNIAEVLPEMLARDIIPDCLTDQTSAHDLRQGYIPSAIRWKPRQPCANPIPGPTMKKYSTRWSCMSKPC